MTRIIFIQFQCDFMRFQTLFVKIRNRRLKSGLTRFYQISYDCILDSERNGSMISPVNGPSHRMYRATHALVTRRKCAPPRMAKTKQGQKKWGQSVKSKSVNSRSKCTSLYTYSICEEKVRIMRIGIRTLLFRQYYVCKVTFINLIFNNFRNFPQRSTQIYDRFTTVSNFNTLFRASNKNYCESHGR